MKSNSKSLRVILSLVLLLVLVSALTLPLATGSLAQGGDPWEAEEAAADERARKEGRGKGQSQEVGEPALHSGHLGYDKDSGQFLEDPTVKAVIADSPAEQAEMERHYEQKLQEADASRVTFRSGLTIHPDPGIAPSVLDALTSPGTLTAGGNYYVIQFSYPFPTEARNKLEAAGVRFYDYADVAALYAWVPTSAVAMLQDLLAEGVVRYLDGIPAEAKMDPGLGSDVVKGLADAANDIVVLTFEEPTPAQLTELAELLAVERRSDGPIHILEGKASGSSISALAELDYVRWVERQAENTLGNLEGGMGIGGDVLHDMGFDGTGVEVMVVDTGIARDGSTYHPDLPSSRILDQYDYQNSDTNAADDHSHGTHVASSIGGSFSGSSPSKSAWQGVAPAVDFLIYKLCCGTGQFSSAWFQAALDRATSGGRTAHISSNSWGGYNGVYNTNSEIADRAVRGEYNSQPVNMVIISHNDDDLSRAPGTGKNVITVGSVKDGNYPNTPFTSCDAVDEYDWPPGTRVCYSNYGPIDIDGDGFSRVKPDVMAPGAMIYAAAPWYLYNPAEYYRFKHGTSMAAPHVAGALAQILDAFSSSNAWLFDWPEVVKAMLLATTVDVGGNTDLYGRGLIDPYHAVYYESGISASMAFWGNSVSTSGEGKEFTFSVPAGFEEVRVVLTWADPAGAAEVSNDLDILSVKDGNGISCGGSARYDDTVEYLKVTSSTSCTPGNWTVKVLAYSLSEPQRFGLAAHPILKKSDLNISANADYPSGATSLDPGTYFYFHQYVSNSGYTAGGSYARLSVPSGFQVHGVRVYSADGRSHYYDDSEVYHLPGSNYWRVAVGETLAANSRHARWYLRTDADATCGPHSFGNTAYWREAGSLKSSGGVYTDVSVTCEVYLPTVFKSS